MLQETNGAVWMFEGVCPKGSKLGILLRVSTDQVLNGEEVPEDPYDQYDLMVRVVNHLNEAANSDIKPADMLGLGSDYFVTESGRRNAGVLRRYFDRKEKEVKDKNSGRVSLVRVTG